jgi:peroxiredoxin
MMAAVGAAPNVKVGDQVPDVSLDSGFPPESVKLRDLTKGKRVVLVGLPGAFTPT